MRWRWRLSEFDFEIHYRPGRVHQVPDALSRLISPSTDNKPVDDEIPTVGDHHDPVLVATRSRKADASGSSREQDVSHTLTHEEDEALDDTFDEALDLFDLDLADAPHEPLDGNIANVPSKLTIPEILEAQKTDAFCQTVLSSKPCTLTPCSTKTTTACYIVNIQDNQTSKQIVMPESLRPRILKLAHYSKLASGHPGQTRMYYHVRRTYYWPHMAADIYATVRTVLRAQRTGSSYASTRIRSSYFQPLSHWHQATGVPLH